MFIVKQTCNDVSWGCMLYNLSPLLDDISDGVFVFDSRRTGSIPVYCLKLAIGTLSQARLDDKYRCE